jgi:hypothetical protein
VANGVRAARAYVIGDVDARIVEQLAVERAPGGAA